MRSTAPKFLTLESIRLYGIPTEIDGAQLTLKQARILAGMVENAQGADPGKLAEAIADATSAFRKVFVVKRGRWASRTTIRTSGGVEFRNKFKDERDEMGRTRGKYKRPPMEALLEAGARNSKKDAKAIEEVIRLALDQLNKADRLPLLKKLGYRIKEV